MTIDRSNTFRRLEVLGVLAATLLVLPQCGYQPVTSTIPGGAPAVIIPLVENQTAYGGLAAALSAALRREIALRGLRVARGEEEQSTLPRLEVTMIAVGHEPNIITVNNQRLTPAERIVSITVSARLVDDTGALLAGPVDFTSEGESLVGQTSLAEESLAEDKRGELLMKLASRVASRFFDSL